MATYTWNVIFMGINLRPENTAISNNQTQTIRKGLEVFKRDVSESAFSNMLNITLLHFESTSQTDKALIYRNINKMGKNALVASKVISKFDCQNVDCYSNFFSDEVSRNPDKENQKYILIFLAHSFGAGYFPQKNTNGIGYESFSTIELSQAIQKGFEISKDKLLDCFIAINCFIQSIETNIAFSDKVKYLIGSQQPLEVMAITYKKLLDDLTYQIKVNDKLTVGLDDQIIFSKFIYNCYTHYKHKIETIGGFSNQGFDNFCLSLTNPPASEGMKALLDSIPQIFHSKTSNQNIRERDVDYWLYASAFCTDPSFTQQINIIDANQFFLKLRTFYTESAEQLSLIEKILLVLRQMLLLNGASADLCESDIDEYNLYKIFLPTGIGFLMPKLLSETLLANTELLYPVSNATDERTPLSKDFGLYLRFTIRMLNLPITQKLEVMSEPAKNAAPDVVLGPPAIVS